MDSVDLKNDPVWRRAEAAWKRRSLWDSPLDDAFRYVIPGSTIYGNQTPGQQNYAQIYDSTAIEALSDRVARDHGAIFPSGEPFMGAELHVPVELADAAAGVINQAIENFHRAVERSNFHLQIGLAQMEAYISTGCIDIHMGTPDNPLRFEAVSIAEVAPEPGHDGRLQSGYRKFTLTGAEIKARWPDADVGPELSRQIEEKPDEPVAVMDAVARDDDAGVWRYRVYLQKPQSADVACRVVDDEYRGASPRVMFRIDQSPGEWMGRGPVLAQMPNIRTANKVVELILKNASLAVTGIFQADDDGVLNPATVELVPGAIIPKAMGSSGLTPVETGARFDVAQIVLGDLRDQIRRAIVGPALPPANLGDRRSATEIAGRMSEQAAVEVPRMLRLTGELLQPLAARVFQILTHPSMRGSPYYIPPLGEGDQAVYPVPQPPLSRVREMQEVDRAAAGMGVMLQLFPEQVSSVVNLENFVRHQLEARGVRPDDFKTEEEIAADEAQGAQAQMLEMAAVAAGEGE